MLQFRFAITLQFFLLTCGSVLLQAQTTYMFTNNTYVDHLRTVNFGPTGFEHLFPMLELGGRQSLTLSFDDVESEVRNYVYTIIHCDRNWEPSGLRRSRELLPLDFDERLQPQSVFEQGKEKLCLYGQRIHTGRANAVVLRGGSVLQ